MTEREAIAHEPQDTLGRPCGQLGDPAGRHLMPKIDTRRLGKCAVTVVAGVVGLGAAEGAAAPVARAATGTMRDCLNLSAYYCSYPQIHKLSNTHIRITTGGHQLCIRYHASGGGSYPACTSYNTQSDSYYINPFRYKQVSAATRLSQKVYWTRASVVYP